MLLESVSRKDVSDVDRQKGDHGLSSTRLEGDRSAYVNVAAIGRK